MAVHGHNARGRGRLDVGLYTATQDEGDTFVSFATRVLDVRPDSASLLQERALVFARRGDWKRAADDYLSLVELDPDDFKTCMRAATLLARAGETARYREALQNMFRRLGDAELVVSASDAEKVAKSGLIVATPASSLGTVTKLAIRARSLAVAGPGQAWMLPWAQLAVGWAEFRNGNYPEAIRWCEESLAHDRLPYRDCQAKFILAMAHFSEKDLSQARQALEDGERIFQKNSDPTAWFAGEEWHDWIICRFLREEARGML